MTLFSRKLSSKEKEVKFVGVHLPLPLNSYLTLYSLTMEQSKSSIICDALSDWKEIFIKEFPLSKMIEVLAKKALDSYDKKGRKKGLTFHRFTEEIKSELSKKGINEEIILQIIKEMKDGKD